MNKLQIIVVILSSIIFFTGAYLILTADNIKCSARKFTENMESGSCPTMLIQKGNVLLLYNSNEPEKEGKNPLPFYNLDEYINYLEIQKKKGKKCPVLYLQTEMNAQGDEVYRMRPSPFDLQGGLPASTGISTPVVEYTDANRDNLPYNKDMYAGFDAHNMYVGVETELDVIHKSTEMGLHSDSPLDSNWGGADYTRESVKSGKYAGRVVSKPVLSTPKNTAFYPSIPSTVENPIDVL